MTARDRERLYRVRLASAGRFDADGTLLFVSDLAGAPHVWALRPASWPEVVVAPDDRAQRIFPGPRPGLLGVEWDRGGNERSQLLVVRDGEATAVTNDPAHVHHFGAWSPDGRRFAFASNARDPRWFDVLIHDLPSGKDRVVLRHDSTNEVFDWSADGASLLVRRVFSNSQHELWLVDVEAGAARLLTPSRARYLDARFLPRGLAIVLLTNLDRDVTVPSLLPVEEGAPSALGEVETETDSLAVSPDGAVIAYALNRDGANEIVLRSLTDGVERVVSGLPRGSLYEYWQSGLAFDRAGKKLAISWTGDAANPDVWTCDVTTGRARQATHAPRLGLSPRRFVASEVVRYPTFDGREIPALWYSSRRSSGAAVVYVHGGPESQFRPSWQAAVQHLVAEGFGVLAPNVRGSTGYGREYEHLDDVRKRMDSVHDLAQAARWLASSGRADASRIGVMGGSYGGFMVLAALTSDPDVWAAGVCLVGIANFVTFLEKTGAYRRHLREAEYGSLEHDREFLESISPINRVDRIRAPLLLIHGANDPRVPIGEAEQMRERLRAFGRTAELIRFDDEGHQIAKTKNKVVAYPAAVAFFRAHLT